MTDPMPTPPMSAPPASDGKTLGIVGLVLAFVFALAGLIVSLIAKSQSKRAGVPNTPATVGVVLSIVFLIVQIIVAIMLIMGAIALVNQCAEYGPGVHDLDGVTLTCG